MAEAIPTDKVVQLRAQGYTNSQIIDMLQHDGYQSEQIFNAITNTGVPDAGASPQGGDAMDLIKQDAPEMPPPAPSPQGAPETPPNPPSTPSSAPEMPPSPPKASAPAAPPSPPSEDITPHSHSMHKSPRSRPNVSHSSTSRGSPMGDVSTEEYVEAVIEEKWRDIEEDVQKIVAWKNRSESRMQHIEQSVIDLKDRFDKLHAALIGKIESYDKNIVEVGAEIKAMEKVFSKVLPVFTDNVKQLSDVADRMDRKSNK